MSDRKRRVQSKLAIVIAVCALLGAGVSTVWAARWFEASPEESVARVTPVATPVELNPCASGACW